MRIESGGNVQPWGGEWMPSFELRDPDVERRIRQSFARQGLMRTIGATLTRVSAGEVEIEIEIPFQSALTQQHGYVTRASLRRLWTMRAAMRR